MKKIFPGEHLISVLFITSCSRQDAMLSSFPTLEFGTPLSSFTRCLLRQNIIKPSFHVKIRDNLEIIHVMKARELKHPSGDVAVKFLVS